MERNRREGPLKGEDLRDSAALVGERGGTETLERWELTEWLNGGLNLLDERCREFLISLYFDDPQGPSYAEVAERFGMPVGSVGPTRARCLERLKRALKASRRSGRKIPPQRASGVFFPFSGGIG